MKHMFNRSISVLAIFALALTFAPPALAEEDEAPIIEELDARPLISQAVITWETDITTTGKVEYGTAPGTYTMSVTTGDRTRHHVRLKDLATQETYYFRVTATSLDGVSTTSQELNFTTLPKGLAFLRLDVIDRAATKALFSVKLNKSAYITLRYGTALDGLTELAEALEPTSAAGMTDILLLASGLKANTTYYYRVTVNRSDWLAPGAPEFIDSGIGIFTTTGKAKITSISPTSGFPGITLTIRGTDFGTGPTEKDRELKHAVLIGCTPKNFPRFTPRCTTTITSWSDTKITARITGVNRTGRVYVAKGVRVIDSETLFSIKGPTFTVLE